MNANTRTLRALWLLLALLLAATAPAAAVPWPSHPDRARLVERTQAAVDRLGAELGDDATRGYDALLAEAAASGERSPHAAAGLVAFMNQQLELATWLYGQGVLAEPDNAVYANNFALGLHEKALMAAGGTDRALLELARDHFSVAVGADPRNATYVANLGYAELELVRGSDDVSLYGEALYALRIATELAPDSASAWAHYADALAASGDAAGAIAALQKARALAPFNGAVLATGGRVPADVMAGSLAGDGGSAACAIDYGCDENCPRSIIGQIDLVTCRIAESSAQSACSEGKVYAPAFDCAEKIPEFGILIPGLNSGFSMPTPFGRLDVTVDGAGNVDFRFKWSTSAPGLGGEVSARGSWSPESGFSSVEVQPGVTYSFVGGQAARQLSELEMGPGQIAIEGRPDGTVEIKIEAYGGAVFSH